MKNESLIKIETVEENGETAQRISVPTPKEIKVFLDKHIIGQDEAKKVMSTAIYKHYMRIMQPDTNDGVSIEKTNVLLLGPSGCGKTQIARQIAKLLGLPFTIFDISNVSASGYVGNDLVFCLKDLVDAAGGNIALAQNGIVFIDEFNKIARKSGANNSISQDVSGEKVQGELLRMIEDGVVDVPVNRGRLNPEAPMFKLDCSNILFIFAGAFEGLDKIIEKRIGTKKTIGFATKEADKEKYDEKNLLQYVSTEDLLDYGIMRELVSRMPTITYVNNLTKEQLIDILTKPENAIVKQIQKMFKMNGKDITFDKKSLERIAELAEEKHTGARALRGIIEKVIDEFIYNIDDSKTSVKVTVKDINKIFKQNKG